MLIYVAGPLFSDAERAWLDVLAARLRAEGFDCFVPHENFSELKELTPGEVFRIDAAGVRGKAVTPFLLAHFHEATGGESLRANIEIILANAALGARIAVAAAAGR